MTRTNPHDRIDGAHQEDGRRPDGMELLRQRMVRELETFLGRYLTAPGPRRWIAVLRPMRVPGRS